MAGVFATLANGYPVCAAEPAGPRLTLANVPAPVPYRPDEPVAKQFSLERTALALDTAALFWIKDRACVACHTTIPYLMARSALDAVTPSPPEVRQFFEDLAEKRKDAFPKYLPADGRMSAAIGIATALAFHDRMTTGKLHPATRKAFDQVWSMQRPDGGWEWPFRDSPPIKMTEHYGVTFVAVGVGLAPEGYAKSEAARKGLEGIRKFLRANLPASLHERAMLLWAAQHFDDLFPKRDRDQTVQDLLAAQRSDGGWSLANLVDNVQQVKGLADQLKKSQAKPGYGKEFLAYVGRSHVYESPLTTDGYATGFAVYVLRQAGVPAKDQRIQRGIAWLKNNQRQSGRWFTPSQAFHKQHLISNAGTCYAVMALQACGEVPARSPKRAASE
ncbi:MAG TPA: prenyltransferase/squalene oxidase repeat-containing protein [Gemmataceae bacterium]|nr:prenyltransferase/squalene oxidase repeat-containing protein [Gemmataceae bacterium]